MFEKLKANILFHKLLKRPDISKAYKMVGPEDSWYDTITRVHDSLAGIRQNPHEDWELTSHDGLKLKALFYPGTSDKTMIWVHGYTSHAERESAFPALFYRSLGYNVLIPYLRAHGPSEGKYIAFGALEYRDMMGWTEKVNQRFPEGGIVFHGLSMGGGIILDLACQEIRNVRCLVCDAPSYNIDAFLADVSRGVFKKDHAKVYACLAARFLKEFGVPSVAFDRITNIKRGKYPILLSAGSNENMDEILHSIQENNPADTEILILPGCNHGNGMYKQTELYQSTIHAFLKKYDMIPEDNHV